MASFFSEKNFWPSPPSARVRILCGNSVVRKTPNRGLRKERRKGPPCLKHSGGGFPCLDTLRWLFIKSRQSRAYSRRDRRLSAPRPLTVHSELRRLLRSRDP